MFKVLFVQINLLGIPLFIKLSIGFRYLGHKLIQGIPATTTTSLLLLLFFKELSVMHFMVRLMHTFVLIDVLCIFACHLTLAIGCAVHILKDEVGRDLLPSQGLAFVQSAGAVLIVDRRIEGVLKFLAMPSFLHNSLCLLLAPTILCRRQEIIATRPHLKGPILILRLLRLGVSEGLIG